LAVPLLIRLRKLERNWKSLFSGENFKLAKLSPTCTTEDIATAPTKQQQITVERSHLLCPDKTVYHRAKAICRIDA
jgi:hypothetical protein